MFVCLRHNTTEAYILVYSSRKTILCHVQLFGHCYHTQSLCQEIGPKVRVWFISLTQHKDIPTFPCPNNTHFEMNICTFMYRKYEKVLIYYIQKLTSFRMTLSYCFPRGSHPFFPKPNVLQEAEGDRTGDHAPLWCAVSSWERASCFLPSSFATRSHYSRNKGSWSLRALSDSLLRSLISERTPCWNTQPHFLLSISLNTKLKSREHRNLPTSWRKWPLFWKRK